MLIVVIVKGRVTVGPCAAHRAGFGREFTRDAEVTWDGGIGRSSLCDEFRHTVDAAHGNSTHGNSALCKVVRPVSRTTSRVDRRTLDLISPCAHKLAIRRVDCLHRSEMSCILWCAARACIANLTSYCVVCETASSVKP